MKVDKHTIVIETNGNKVRRYEFFNHRELWKSPHIKNLLPEFLNILMQMVEETNDECHFINIATSSYDDQRVKERPFETFDIYLIEYENENCNTQPLYYFQFPLYVLNPSDAYYLLNLYGNSFQFGRWELYADPM